MFTWMDLKTRKSIVPPEQLKNMMAHLQKSMHYREMTEEEIRMFDIPKKSLDTLHI
jgi:hypothetical protein